MGGSTVVAFASFVLQSAPLIQENKAGKIK